LKRLVLTLDGLYRLTSIAELTYRLCGKKTCIIVYDLKMFSVTTTCVTNETNTHIDLFVIRQFV